MYISISIFFRVNFVNILEIIWDVVDCKKKWQDILSVIKKKEVVCLKEMRGIGGGFVFVEDIKIWERFVSFWL